MNRAAAKTNIPLSVDISTSTLDLRRETDARKQVIAFSMMIGKQPEPGFALTDDESDELAACEVILQKQPGAIFEIGSALFSIQEGRLYRSSHATFEQYCLERWNMDLSYAGRFIEAARIDQRLERES